MNTIKERYVNREIAKLLKDKGFDIPVNYEYHYLITVPQFHRKKHDFNGIEYRNCSSEWYSAPTQAMACDWLTENYKIHIDVSFVSGKGFVGSICDISNPDNTLYMLDTKCYPNIESVYNEALKYILTTMI